MDRQEPDGDNTTVIDDWCYSGVQRGYGGRCPAGYYCEAGVTNPVKCPAGSYSSSEGASFCDECPEGKLLVIYFVKFILNYYMYCCEFISD